MDTPQFLMRLDAFDNLPPLAPPPGVTLRHYQEGDEAAWDAMVVTGFPNWRPPFDPFMKEDPSFKPERICFALINGEIGATASAFRRPQEYGEDVGYLHMVASSHRHTGKGLGYWATLAALWRMREDGCRTAVLTTDDFRLPAIKTYLKLGFKIEFNHPSIEGRWAAVIDALENGARKGSAERLWPNGAPGFDASLGQEEPALTPFLAPGGGVRGAVIVCPGGGYERVVGHEGEPIARMLCKHGIHAFVLNYRVAPYRHPVPLGDAQRAIRYVRFHAERFGIAPDRIGIMGFSAGGHLTAMAATHYDAGDASAADLVDRVSCRPDCFLPCYAVASFAAFAHGGSVNNLLGNGDRSITALKALSAEYCVTADTPPCFMWHTAGDAGVPVENSLRLAAALGDKGVKYALHIFPDGGHGLGLAADTPYTSNWARLCGEWLLNMGWGQRDE